MGLKPNTAGPIEEVPIISMREAYGLRPMFKVVAKKGDPGKTVHMKILSPSNFNCRSSYSFIRSGIQVLADAGRGG